MSDELRLEPEDDSTKCELQQALEILQPKYRHITIICQNDNDDHTDVRSCMIGNKFAMCKHMEMLAARTMQVLTTTFEEHV